MDGVRSRKETAPLRKAGREIPYPGDLAKAYLKNRGGCTAAVDRRPTLKVEGGGTSADDPAAARAWEELIKDAAA